MRQSALITILIFILSSSGLLFASGKATAPVSLYKQNYFIFGKDLDAKFQLSYRIRLVQFPKDLNLFVSHTHKADWAITTLNSAPFREHNFNPEIHLRWDEPKRFLFAEHVQIGYEHESTGVADSLSRGWERLTAHVEWTFLDKNYSEPGHIHTYLRGWIIVDKDTVNNPDIGAYLGYGEFGLSYTLHEKKNIPAKSVLSLTARFRSFMLEYALGIPKVDFLGYIQYWYGRGEFLTRYKEHDNIFRLGIRFHVD